MHLCIQFNLGTSNGQDVKVNSATLLTLQLLVSSGVTWDATCDKIVESRMAWIEAPALRLCILRWTQELADGVGFSHIPVKVITRGFDSTRAFIDALKTSSARGETSHHKASSEDQLQVVQLLLETGANSRARNKVRPP
jgi:hypothetical protein